jgi:hypothetical protein
MLGMDNVLFHRKTRYTIQSSNDIEAQVSVPTKKQNLIQLGWIINDRERQYLLQRGIDPDFCRTAAEVALRLDIEGFIDALVVFVRECRNRFDEVPVTNASVVRRESNSLWVEGLPVTLHPSIRCWRRKGDDSNNLEMLSKEYVRCKEGWQAGKEWRRDYLWVQDTKTDGSLLGSKRVGQL